MKTLQFLIDNHWVDIHTRARTDEGMRRIYERARKEAPSDSVLCPTGMRLITIHEEHLGALPKVTLKITKREIGPLRSLPSIPAKGRKVTAKMVREATEGA